MSALLEWFDRAELIVAYNGRAFDMRVLRALYGGDEARRDAHLAKLHDPMDVVRQAAGRRMKLSTLLSKNTRTRKGGTGCDAPRWWEEGRLRRLEEYCAQDVSALVELVTRKEVRVGEHTTTRDMCVWRVLRDERESQRRGEKRTGVEAQLQERPARGAGGDDAESGAGSTAADGASSASDAADGEGEEPATSADGVASGSADSPSTVHATTDDEENNERLPATDLVTGSEVESNEGRPKRKRKRADGGEGGTYDETARRAPRRQRTVRYMARPGRGGAKRNAIEVGATVVERVTRGRYEWRDGGLRPTRGARKRVRGSTEARGTARQRT